MNLRNQNRFDNYRELISKFNSTGACGHPIAKGDTIGWTRRFGAQCQACWLKWKSENAEAQAVESGYMPSCL